MTDLRWRKSTYSGANENCVEVADTRAHRHVRDSKHAATGPSLTFTRPRWHTFTTRQPTCAELRDSRA